MLSKNYSVARVVQYTTADIGKSERHIERKNESYENMNVDLSRTPLNVHFRGCGELTYNTRLDELVAAGAVSLRGLKKDAKVFDEMIFDVNTAYTGQCGRAVRLFVHYRLTTLPIRYNMKFRRQRRLPGSFARPSMSLFGQWGPCI